MVNDLNLRTTDRISVALVGLCVLLLPLSVVEARLLYPLASFLAAIVVLNCPYYRFLFQKRGLPWAALVFPLHCFYFFYSGAIFTGCWLMRVLRGKRQILTTAVQATTRKHDH